MFINLYIRNPYADNKNKSAKEGTGETISSTLAHNMPRSYSL